MFMYKIINACAWMCLLMKSICEWVDFWNMCKNVFINNACVCVWMCRLLISMCECIDYWYLCINVLMSAVPVGHCLANAVQFRHLLYSWLVPESNSPQFWSLVRWAAPLHPGSAVHSASHVRCMTSTTNSTSAERSTQWCILLHTPDNLHILI